MFLTTSTQGFLAVQGDRGVKDLKSRPKNKEVIFLGVDRPGTTIKTGRIAEGGNRAIASCIAEGGNRAIASRIAKAEIER